MSEDHTGENIAETVNDFIEEWEIAVSKCVCFTTDCGSNIVKVINLMKINRISCFGHTINSAVNQILLLEDLVGVIAKIKKLQNLFAHSWKLARDLSVLQKRYDLPQRKVPSFAKTRWWSMLRLMEVILEQNIAITK